MNQQISAVIEDSKKLLEAFDAAWKSQPDGQADAKLMVLANYGDLALNNLRAIVQNWPGDTTYAITYTRTRGSNKGELSMYNGHKDWSHWNVSLWIRKDEGLYRQALDCLRRSCTGTLGATHMMLDHLNEMGITETPDGARYTARTIRAAMRGLT